MPRESFSPSGIIQDIPASELARYGHPDAWTAGANIVFRRGPAEASSKGVEVFSVAPNGPLGPPLDVFSSIDFGLNAWMYPHSDGVTRGIGVTDGQTHKDITPAAFTPWTSDTENIFTDFSVSGLPGFNWGTAAAYWTRDFGLPSLMQPMPGTDPAGAPDNTYVPLCRSMRSHVNRLIAINTRDDTGGKGWANTEETVVWSSLPPDGNSMPDDWYPRIDNSAGSAELSGGGPAIDGFSLRSSFIVYLQNRIYIMDEVGGSLVFNIRKMSTSTGVLSRNCVAPTPEGHVVLSGDDCFIIDGQSMKSIVDNEIKVTMFKQMGDNFQNSFVIHNKARNETLVCIPTGSNIYPNLCYTFDHGTRKWGIRELPNLPAADIGPIPFPAGNPVDWDSQVGDWDSQSRIWNQAVLSSAVAGLVFADPALNASPSGSTKRFISLDPIVNGDNANLYSSPYIERADYDFGDASRLKTITKIWPRVTFDFPDQELWLSISTRDSTTTEDWENKVLRYQFGSPELADGLSVFATGRYFRITFSRWGSSLQNWDINGFDVEFEFQGGY